VGYFPRTSGQFTPGPQFNGWYTGEMYSSWTSKLESSRKEESLMEIHRRKLCLVIDAPMLLTN